MGERVTKHRAEQARTARFPWSGTEQPGLRATPDTEDGAVEYFRGAVDEALGVMAIQPFSSASRNTWTSSLPVARSQITIASWLEQVMARFRPGKGNVVKPVVNLDPLETFPGRNVPDI